jgi:hypothetical protein
VSPADVLLALLEAGAVVWEVGGQLRYRAPVGALTEALRGAAAGCRGSLTALVRAGAVLPLDRAAWPPAWREAFEERAGFIEFEGGQPRAAAEQEAERLVRLEHARAFVHRSALVVTPEAGAVATTRPGSGPHRRP